MPQFFIYAKDKDKKSVEAPNKRFVDSIRKHIPRQTPFVKNKTLGKFDYRVLLDNPDFEETEISNLIVEKYKELTKNIRVYMAVDKDDYEKNNYHFLFRKIREEILQTHSDIDFVVDSLVYYLFHVKKTAYKYVFWQCFGDIVLSNIQNNLDNNYIYCQKCGKRYMRNHFNDKFCTACKNSTTDILVCADCGEPFEVARGAKNRARCPRCYEAYRKKNVAQNVRKLRAKNEM